MEIELLNLDMQNYLNKYTRFMSKKVYITKRMYDNFVNSYEYIYDSANGSIINYDNDINYKKLLEIKDKGLYALKMHNKKYLDNLYVMYGDKLSDNLSKREKLTILCEEDIVVMDAKNLDNKIKLALEKVFYLEKFCNLSYKNICIIGNDEVKDKLSDIDVDVLNFKEFGSLVCNDNRKIIDDLERYQVLSLYIKDVLYTDKKKFKKFYEVFFDKLYFNEDAMDFETFKDYHSYMFKRKLRDNKMNISEFVKSLIVDRRRELKCVSGEIYDDGILVDIANTLFCSGINYKYDYQNKYFVIYNDDIFCKIMYIDKGCNVVNNNDEDVIYLYSDYKDGTNACEHLIYELVKRRYPIEKKSYEELYDILKNDMLDCYFSRFIKDVVISYIDMINKYEYSYDSLIDKVNNLDGNLKVRFEILLEISQYYFDYLKDHNLIDKERFNSLVKKNISFVKYKYLIVIDNQIHNMFMDDVKFKLLVIKDKKVFPYSYLMSNVKLFCDFKKYLNCEKVIPIVDVYYGDNEIENIAMRFTSINKDRVCNVYGDVITKKKKVEIYIYDDNDKLNTDINCNYLLNKVIGNICIDNNKKIMIMGRDSRDRDMLTLGNYFKFSNKNRIVCNEFSEKFLDYCFMDSEDMSVYETGILIHPMDDKYGFKYDCLDEELLQALCKDSVNSYEWEKKLFYMAISRVKTKLYVVVPKSGVSKFVRDIANHNDVLVKKEVFSALVNN